MSVSPTAVNATPNSGILIRDSHLLPCQAIFRTRDLDLSSGAAWRAASPLPCSGSSRQDPVLTRSALSI